MSLKRRDDLKQELWYSVGVTIALNAREAIEYGFMEAGALGTETVNRSASRVEVCAYFDQRPDPLRLRASLLKSLRIYGFNSSSLTDLHFGEVEDRDWLEEWKRGWQPVEIGDRLIVAPPWSDVGGRTERVIVRIEPGMAFGTGTHETTRLCLAAIERHFDGRSLLDVGTGTGILAIAAALLFPATRIEACDTDADAIAIACENARLNKVGDRINFRTGSIQNYQGLSADLVCANLTADIINIMLPALLEVSCKRLVLSGILESQADALLSRLRDLGIAHPPEVNKDGEWVAIIV